LLGVLIVVVVSNGMVLMGVAPYVQQGVQGVLIITAVAIALDRAKARIVK
jgi:ribose transport system permease protein